MTRIFVALGLVVGMALMSQTARADGATDFSKKCASCHGKDAKGQTKVGIKLKVRDLTDAKVQGEYTDATMLEVIKNGTKDKDTGKAKMPAFASKLTDDQIKAVVTYIRGLAKK